MDSQFKIVISIFLFISIRPTASEATIVLNISSVPRSPVYVEIGKTLTLNISYVYNGSESVIGVIWTRKPIVKYLIQRSITNKLRVNDQRASLKDVVDLVLKDVTMKDNATFQVQLSTDDEAIDPRKDIQVIVLEQPIAVISGCSSSSPNYVNETENISCLCTSRGGNPPPSVVWLKNGKQITSEGFLQQTLTITNAAKNDTGNYTCNATSHTLSDRKNITILVKWKPKITVQCDKKNTGCSITLNETEGISCKCQSEDGIPKPKVFWLRKDDGSVVSSRRDLSNTLKQTMTRQNKGVYICRAETYPDTTVWFTEYELKILVNYAPEITSFTSDVNLPAYINTTITLTCKADAFPLADYILTRNGTILHETIETSNLTYVINQIGSPNIGEYLCVASNFLGSQNKALTITMTVLKPTALTPNTTATEITTSTTNCGSETNAKANEDNNDGHIPWYIAVITFLCGLLIATIVIYVVIKLRHRVTKQRKHQQNNNMYDDVIPSEAQPPVYQELNLKDMNQPENYQALKREVGGGGRSNNGVDVKDSNYQELNNPRGRSADNYQTLQKT